MNEQKGGGSVAPLFYIIQPEIQIKRSEQNNQEIYHSRKVIVESPLATVEAEQERAALETEPTKMKHSMHEIQKEVKQISSAFNIPVNIQVEAMKRMGKLGGNEEMDSVPLKDDSVRKMETISVNEQDVYEDESMDDYKKSVRMQVTRLARYPLVVPKPLCELMIQGEKVNAVIESKRGEMVRLRVGAVTQSIPIDDIEDIKLL